MSKSSKIIGYTEEQMADAFERRLHSRRPLPAVGRMSQVFREVECHRGRPDFVAMVSRMRSQSPVHQSSHNIASARALALLKRRSPRSVLALAKQMDMAEATVRRALSHLEASGLVEQLANGSFVLSGGSAIFEMETMAFELKLKNPRRAVFQAQQYTLFAHQVWIVVPPLQSDKYDSYRPVLNRWGVGLATFNPRNHRFSPIIKARRRIPGSREHHAYAILRLVGT